MIAPFRPTPLMDYNFGEACRKVFRTRFVTELRSAQPAWTRLRVELRVYELPIITKDWATAPSRAARTIVAKNLGQALSNTVSEILAKMDVTVPTSPAASPLHLT